MGKRLLAPPLDWFEQWMKKTDEPIPDFEALPSVSDLPDLLRFEDGTLIESPDRWPRRRRELSARVQHWLIGSWPTQPPVLTGAGILAETRGEGVTSRHVRLTFSGPQTFSFDVEVMIPSGPGPFPVFMTQANHRRWAALGVTRGYLGCVYPGADSDDQSDQLKAIYADHDWSKLTRRAWLGCRALDYVLTLPEADAERVGITGHSRNGKQSLIAAAMDKRISAVVSSSSGSGGVVPWRCSSEFCFQESVEFMTRQTVTADWFHPRIRLFTGREDRLPVDTHALLGLIAPRACLVSDAMTDGCGSMFGVEMSVAAGRRVYDLLGHPDRLALMWRWGNHETDAQVIERYFDWYDTVFAQETYDFPQTRFYDLPKTMPHVDPPASETPAHARLQWLLGEAPPTIGDPGGRYGAMPAHRAAMVGLDRPPEGIQHISLSFADYVRGEFFFPTQYEAPLRPVIWLHPFSHSYGTSGAYMVGGQVFHRLAREGYAVLAFTQLGCGQRTEEGRDFYSRHPRWSKMGKMVRDVRGAVDLLISRDRKITTPLSSSSLELPEMDSTQIVLLGYSLGGLTALLATALDERVSAVASFCGAVPLKKHEIVAERGCMQRFWQLPDLLPRLSECRQNGKTPPLGLHDVLGMIAPRPCLLVAPIHDREIDVNDVRKSVEQAGPYDAMSFHIPRDYNRFQSDQHDMVLEWLKGL